LSLELHLKRHNDPSDEYCLYLHETCLLGHDVKDMLAMIHFNLPYPHFVANAVHTIETGWDTQLNCYVSIGFCRANIDMTVLGFNTMGLVNNPACWSFIPHQAEGKQTYTLAICDFQKTVLSPLKAKTTKDLECPFTTCLKELLARPSVQKCMTSNSYRDGKLQIHKAHCDQLVGWLALRMKYLEWIQILAPVISPASFLICCQNVFLLISSSCQALPGADSDYNGFKWREVYSDFYGKDLQVADVNVLTFTTHV
jgi:hypothetical protein